MNHIIIKLAKESNVLRTEYTQPKYGIYSEPSLSDLMQFALLVVKECAYIADRKEKGDETFDSNISTSWYIKKHFGIE